MKKSNLLEKIKKLQQTAESYEGMGLEEAARLYAEKVQELLFENKLSMSDVDATILDSEDPIEPEYARNDAMKEGKRLWWAEHLSRNIAKYHFCKTVLDVGEGSIRFIGRESDREVAIYMFVYLSRTMVSIMKSEKKRLQKEEKIIFKEWQNGARHFEGYQPFDNKGFKNNFYLGFIRAITDRYREQAEQFKTENSTALVKAESDVLNWMEDNMTLRRCKGRKVPRTKNDIAQSLGNEHGRSVSLSTKGVTTTKIQKMIA